MFSKQERRKRKYKSGRNKVCKDEEVRKHSVNPKIESFRLVCKLHYLQFGFRMYRSSRLQILFGREALKNFAMFTVKYLCWSFFLINGWFRWLLLEISYELSLYIWEWWTVSLRGTYWLSSAYFILLCVFRFFLFLSFFLIFFCGFYCLLR